MKGGRNLAAVTTSLSNTAYAVVVGGVVVTHLSSYFACSTGFTVPRLASCFAIAFARPLQPAAFFGAAKAGRAEAIIIVAISRAIARTKKTRFTRCLLHFLGLLEEPN
jgi:hypothetical protein